MAGSYREIDYRVRPGKYAERLMMVEAFRRLRFGSVESYQYVGLGSVYFSDFTLIHRALGISKMISIENNEHDRERFEANIPFGCIEMLWGDTSARLPNVELGGRSIIWLDYDGRLSRPVLGDIAEVSSRVGGGSVLAVTAQCKFDRMTREDGSDASLDAVKEALGAERVPFDMQSKDLRGDGTAQVFWQAMTEEIRTALQARNVGVHVGQQMLFRQFLNFRYEDGVRMMTVAWVFYDAGQQHLYDMCRFEDLTFFRDGLDPFAIAIPKLTPKEIKSLEAQMPEAAGAELQLGAIPPKDARQYATIYRYFPNVAFVES